jgi:hypothetical protein
MMILPFFFQVWQVLTFLGVVYLFYVYIVYKTWEDRFGRQRIARTVNTSPSFKKSPSLVRGEIRREDDVQATKRQSYMRAAPMPGGTGGQQYHATDVMQNQASELHMDHVYISFPSFLWGMTFIGPNALFLWASGVAKLMIRQYLVRQGLMQVTSFDPEQVVASLFLEGTLAIYCCTQTTTDKGATVAEFRLTDFPIVNTNGRVHVAKLFQVDIDLNSKRMVRASLDEEELTASEAMTLAWFHTILANHVKLHALANWGINVEPEQFHNNPVAAQNGVVTVMYNYFGYRTFSSFLPFWKQIGLLSEVWTEPSLIEVIDHGIRSNIVPHSNIRDLQRHSDLVSFLIKVRRIFHAEFRKHHKSFPLIEAEAMFVGTIVHSLDHTTMEWNMGDPLWLNVECPKYGLMAEMGRVIRVGFVDDVPGLVFEKRYKDCRHPFYQAVYTKAAKISQKFADSMDTCIIK